MFFADSGMLRAPEPSAEREAQSRSCRGQDELAHVINLGGNGSLTVNIQVLGR